MSLLAHSGTTAFDLGGFGKSVEAEIAERVTALEKRLQPVLPEIHKLEHTTKDWIFQNGLHRPPSPPIMFHNFAGVTSTASLWFTPSSITLSPSGPYQPYTSSTPLPVEKREMPVIGYRSWKFKPVFRLGFGRHSQLMALNEPYGSWSKGVNHAACKAGGGHRAGDQFCGCGFYVVSDLDAAEHWSGGITDETVVGAVMGWGQVVQHGAEGWRAEYAKIIGLLECKFSRRQDINTQAAAKSYGLEIYSRNALEAYVKEWGDPFAGPVTPPVTP